MMRLQNSKTHHVAWYAMQEWPSAFDQLPQPFTRVWPTWIPCRTERWRPDGRSTSGWCQRRPASGTWATPSSPSARRSCPGHRRLWSSSTRRIPEQGPGLVSASKTIQGISFFLKKKTFREGIRLLKTLVPVLMPSLPTHAFPDNRMVYANTEQGQKIHNYISINAHSHVQKCIVERHMLYYGLWQVIMLKLT